MVTGRSVYLCRLQATAKKTKSNKKASHTNQSNDEKTSIQVDRTEDRANFTSSTHSFGFGKHAIQGDSQENFGWKGAFLSLFDDICK